MLSNRFPDASKAGFTDACRAPRSKVKSVRERIGTYRKRCEARELFCCLPLLSRLRGEFDFDLDAEGAGKEKDEL